VENEILRYESASRFLYQPRPLPRRGAPVAGGTRLRRLMRAMGAAGAAHILLQPFSQNSHTPTVAKEFQIGHYDPTEADLEHSWNSCGEGFLGERLYIHASPGFRSPPPPPPPDGTLRRLWLSRRTQHGSLYGRGAALSTAGQQCARLVPPVAGRRSWTGGYPDRPAAGRDTVRLTSVPPRPQRERNPVAGRERHPRPWLWGQRVPCGRVRLEAGAAMPFCPPCAPGRRD